MTNNEKIVELIGIFEKAKEKFLKDEKEIIEIDINERTLSARLMFHLQTILLEDELYREKYKTYSVDCEYNRINEIEYKILKVCEYIEKTKNFEEVDKKVYPDIIVHKRNENNNLIVIEMKKSTSNNIDCKEKDRERLKIMTNLNDPNNFNYTLGIYFELDITDNNNIIKFFVDEKEYNYFI